MSHSTTYIAFQVKMVTNSRHVRYIPCPTYLIERSVYARNCTLVVADEIESLIIGVHDAPVDGKYRICTPPIDAGGVVDFIDKLAGERRLEQAVKLMQQVPLEQSTIVESIEILTQALNTHTQISDGAWTYVRYPSVDDTIAEYWERYANNDKAMTEDELFLSAERATASCIKAAVTSAEAIPNIADLVTDPSPDDQKLLQSAQDIISGFGSRRLFMDKFSSVWLEFWVACHESPLAAFLFKILRGTCFGDALDHHVMSADKSSMCSELPRISVFGGVLPRREYLFERLAHREMRLVALHHKDIDYNTPFVFDWKNPNHRPALTHVTFESRFDSPRAFWRARLQHLIGFDPEELDLSKCAITGSVICFAMMRPYDSQTQLISHTTGDAHFDGEVRLIRPIGDVEDGVLRCESRYFIDKKEFKRKGKLTQSYDVDVAVFVSTQEELDQVAVDIFTVIEKHYPNATMTKKETTKGHNWAISTKNPSEFLQLPVFEIYPSSIQAICTHHVGPVRGCWTSAGHTHQRPIATATFIRSHVLGTMDNFNYFASRKTMPQQIIYKYMTRGFTIGLGLPNTVIREMIKHVARKGHQWYNECNSSRGIVALNDGLGVLSYNPPVQPGVLIGRMSRHVRLEDLISANEKKYRTRFE